MVMTAYQNDKKQTQELRKIIKPQTPVKQLNPKEKIGEKSMRTLPIRGQ
jgi:hypothetical protein